MAGNERFDDSIGRWLEEAAPNRLPQRVLEATFERTRRTRQESAWRTVLGRLQMPRFVPALGGAAVVLMAAVLALNFLPNLGPGGSATPLPSPTPTPSRTETSLCGDGLIDFSKAGGTYAAPVGTWTVSATVPIGWHGLRDGFHLLRSHCLFGSSFSLDITLVSRVYTDACDWNGTDVEVRTPAEAIAALAAQAGHQTSGPAEVTLDGFRASRFEFSVPAGFDPRSECYEGNGNGSIALWLSPGDPGAGQGLDAGQAMTVYLVDVDGSAVAAAASHSAEDDTPAVIAELDAIVASLRFEP
jgi:hypothetical protein